MTPSSARRHLGHHPPWGRAQANAASKPPRSAPVWPPDIQPTSVLQFERNLQRYYPIPRRIAHVSFPKPGKEQGKTSWVWQWGEPEKQENVVALSLATVKHDADFCCSSSASKLKMASISCGRGNVRLRQIGLLPPRRLVLNHCLAGRHRICKMGVGMVEFLDRSGAEP